MQQLNALEVTSLLQHIIQYKIVDQKFIYPKYSKKKISTSDMYQYYPYTVLDVSK